MSSPQSIDDVPTVAVAQRRLLEALATAATHQPEPDHPCALLEPIAAADLVAEQWTEAGDPITAAVWSSIASLAWAVRADHHRRTTTQEA